MPTPTTGNTRTRSTKSAASSGKRRGRPPGSKNAPKPPEQSQTIGPTMIPFGGSVPGYGPKASKLLSSSVKVVLTSKRAFGDPLAEHVIDWPPEWRLPQAGEAIQVSKTIAGFVEWVTWNIEKKQVEVRLR